VGGLRETINTRDEERRRLCAQLAEAEDERQRLCAQLAEAGSLGGPRIAGRSRAGSESDFSVADRDA
jgi:hypothetical protein